MAYVKPWWQRRWVVIIESVLGHAAAIVVGLVLILLGLGLGVTMIMLPAGIVIALVGVAVLVGGLFAHPMAKR